MEQGEAQPTIIHLTKDTKLQAVAEVTALTKTANTTEKKVATTPVKTGTAPVASATPVTLPKTTTATPITKPQTPVNKPSTPTTPVSKTVHPVNKPETPVAKPATPTSNPKTPAAKPATPVVKPATPVVKSATPVVKPATPAVVQAVFDIDDDEVIDVEAEDEETVTKASPVKVASSPTKPSSTKSPQKVVEKVSMDTEEIINIDDDSMSSTEPEKETKQSPEVVPVEKTTKTKSPQKTVVVTTAVKTSKQEADPKSPRKGDTKPPQTTVTELKQTVGTDVPEKSETNMSEEKENTNEAETKAVVYRDKSKYDYSVPLSKKDKEQGLVGRRLSGRFWKSDRDRFRSVIKSRGLKQVILKKLQ